MIGISSLMHSATAIRSLAGSMMKTAPGRRRIFRIPPSESFSLRSSSERTAASFFVMRSKSPLSWRASSCSRRPSRFLMVTKLVSIPPSQRLVT